MGSFGNLRGVEAPESLLDDPLENLPYLELLYVFVGRKAAYDLRTTQVMTGQRAQEQRAPLRVNVSAKAPPPTLSARFKPQKRHRSLTAAR
jgi:hypothetical protein